MTRLVVLISGGGSNMRAIVEACQSAKLDAKVVSVISNRPDAGGLTFAHEQNIETTVIDHTKFKTRDQFDAQLGMVIKSYKPDFIVLAGFMRILTAELVSRFRGRMINIHPSLLPLYPGLHTHAKVLKAGDTTHGASVHFVTAELDAGPVIAQTQVPVLQNDTEQTLAARVLNTEHELYVQALQLCVSGDARFVDGECYLEKISTRASTPDSAHNGQS